MSSLGKQFTDWMTNTMLGGESSVGTALANNDSLGAQVLNMGIASYMRDATKADSKPVGYQGKIEPRQAVRQQVRQPAAAARDVGNDAKRANFKADPTVQGAKGRSYFTDVIYADKPETEVPTVEEAKKKSKKQAFDIFKRNNPNVSDEDNPYYEAPPVQPETADNVPEMAVGGKIPKFASGGIASAHKGYYLGGKTDGMADQIPARIDNKQEARLSDGEFVIPADVVSHLGNGNSDAGAQQLHGMMDNVRQARTGTTEQGKQIVPQTFMPGASNSGVMAKGGLASGGLARFNKGGGIKYLNEGGDPGSNDGGPEETDVGQFMGQESSLSSWAGDYVTDMLSKGQALAGMGYEEGNFGYEGDLTAGTSILEDQANVGFLDLNNPYAGDSVTKSMGSEGFDVQSVADEGFDIEPYMNPYTQQVIDRTAADMTRQNQMQALQDRATMTNAGAFGGSRDALLRAESAANLTRGIGDMSAGQRQQAYDRAIQQFNQEQDRGMTAQEKANLYGLDALAAQAKAGETMRQVEQDKLSAQYGQFREQRDFPFKQVQYMQSLLQGLPLAAQSYTYTEPSKLDELMGGKAGLDQLLDMFGYDTQAGATTPTDEG
jgi:hypothetical protein